MNSISLGKKIVKIRKDNKMSQEDFAELFNVTRQTISNWENSKSYPDIETIIKISDKFDISLDILLKGDRNMIKEIDKKVKNSGKYKKVLIGILVIVILIVISFAVYCIIYSSRKNILETKFNTAIKENDFYKNKYRYYTLNYNDKITYEVPNQSMPKLLDFSFDFHAKFINCIIPVDNKNEYVLITWVAYNHYGATLIDSKTKETIKDTGLLSKNTNKISKITEKIDIDEKVLKAAIKKGNELHKELYK